MRPIPRSINRSGGAGGLRTAHADHSNRHFEQIAVRDLTPLATAGANDGWMYDSNCGIVSAQSSITQTSSGYTVTLAMYSIPYSRLAV